MKLKDAWLLLGRKAMTNLDRGLKRRHHFSDKCPYNQSIVLPADMYGYESDYKEGWVLKNWWFWIVVLEMTFESPLDCKEIKPVNPKGNQPWIFIGRTDAEAKTPTLWLPDAKNWLIWKDPDAGKDWGQEKKGTTEDEMVGWHHQLNGHGFGWTPGVGDGPGVLQVMGSQRVRYDWVTELHWTGGWNFLVKKGMESKNLL